MSFQSAVNPNDISFDARPKTALLLDDSEFDRRRIKRLNSKMECPLILDEVPDINAMNNCLNQVSFDLIMIDYMLDNEDGLQALEMIKRHKKNQDAAKIMISGSNQPSVAVSALKRGCSDFMSKKELTTETFQKSIYDALKTARPDSVPAGLSVQDVLRQALLDGDLQDVLRDSVRAAMDASGMHQNLTLATYDDPHTLQSLLLGLMDEDDFVFRPLP